MNEYIRTAKMYHDVEGDELCPTKLLNLFTVLDRDEDWDRKYLIKQYSTMKRYGCDAFGFKKSHFFNIVFKSTKISSESLTAACTR